MPKKLLFFATLEGRSRQIIKSYDPFLHIFNAVISLFVAEYWNTVVLEL